MRSKQFNTILANPPWQFQNRTGKVAPEHKRLNRYGMMTLVDIRVLLASGKGHSASSSREPCRIRRMMTESSVTR